MKKILTCLLSLALIVCSPLSALASECSQYDSSPDVIGYLIISDPTTGGNWCWAIESTKNYDTKTELDGCVNKCAEVEVCIRDYIAETLPKSVDISTVLNDDVTLTVGLNYSTNASNNSVAIYRAFGSAPSNGLYYATNKCFYYANPAVFYTISKYPTSSSWSYTTDSTYGNYWSSAPPFALLDCRITIAGMESSYRDVSVICQLSWV